MTRQSKPPTAEILQFPKGGRAGIERSRAPWKQQQNAIENSYDRVVYGSCWYHDEAVSREERSRDH